jgi:hypothetical protein
MPGLIFSILLGAGRPGIGGTQDAESAKGGWQHPQHVRNSVLKLIGKPLNFQGKARYGGALRGVFHAAYFPIPVLQRLLAVPPIDGILRVRRSSFAVGVLSHQTERRHGNGQNMEVQIRRVYYK